MQLPFWQRATLAALATFGIIGFVTLWVHTSTLANTQAACLAATIDKHWSYIGHMRQEKGFEEAEAQAEAIARIHIARALDGSEPLCSLKEWKRWVSVEMWNSTLGATESRRKIIETIAYDAVRGKFKHPWPKEYACVRDYSATRLRFTSRAWNYFTREEVGAIGTMLLYCPSESQIATKKGSVL